MNRPFGLPDAAPLKRIEPQLAHNILPRGWIDGLTLSNDGTDATNDVAIAAGSAKSTRNIVDGAASALTRDQIDLDLPVGIIKQLDVAFAPDNYLSSGVSGGGRSGGRSQASISNATWHVNLIGGRGIKTDVIFHDSADAASTIAAFRSVGDYYTAYRHIGSIVRASGAILPFTQHHDTFILTTPVADIINAADHTTAVTGTLSSCPTGVEVDAIIHVGMLDGAGTDRPLYVTALTQTDSDPNVAEPTVFTTVMGANGTDYAWARINVRTNTSAQIRYRAGNSGVNSIIVTYGWVHPRGKNS